MQLNASNNQILVLKIRGKNEDQVWPKNLSCKYVFKFLNNQSNTNPDIADASINKVYKVLTPLAYDPTPLCYRISTGQCYISFYLFLGLIMAR